MQIQRLRLLCENMELYKIFRNKKTGAIEYIEPDNKEKIIEYQTNDDYEEYFEMAWCS